MTLAAAPPEAPRLRSSSTRPPWPLVVLGAVIAAGALVPIGYVLWYAVGTNQTAVWLMDGTQLLTPGPLILGPYDGG